MSKRRSPAVSKNRLLSDLPLEDYQRLAPDLDVVLLEIRGILHRMARDEFPLTQEFVAMMLGAARPAVSNVASSLQKSGLITYRGGKVAIVDRENFAARQKWTTSARDQ